MKKTVGVVSLGLIAAALAIGGCGGGGGQAWDNDVQLEGLALTIVDPVDGPYTLAGSIVGLTVDGLVLSNGHEQKTYNANAKSFIFTPRPQNEDYKVTVVTQPGRQQCDVAYRDGKLTKTVQDVEVICHLETRSAYALNVVSQTSMNLGRFNFDGATGALTYDRGVPIPFYSVSSNLMQIVPHPFRPFLYVYGDFSGENTLFHVDKDGHLDQMNAGDVNGFSTRFLIAPSGSVVYNLTYGAAINTATIDQTGAMNSLTVATTTSQTVSAGSLALDPNGRYLYYGEDQAIRVLPLNSDGTLVTPVVAKTSTIVGNARLIALSRTGEYAVAVKRSGANNFLETYSVANGVFTSQHIYPLPADHNYDFVNSLHIDPTDTYIAFNASTDLLTFKYTSMQDGTVVAGGVGATSAWGLDTAFPSSGKFVFSPELREIGHDTEEPLRGFSLDALGAPSAISVTDPNLSKVRAIRFY